MVGLVQVCARIDNSLNVLPNKKSLPRDHRFECSYTNTSG